MNKYLNKRPSVDDLSDFERASMHAPSTYDPTFVTKKVRMSRNKKEPRLTREEAKFYGEEPYKPKRKRVKRPQEEHDLQRDMARPVQRKDLKYKNASEVGMDKAKQKREGHGKDWLKEVISPEKKKPKYEMIIAENEMPSKNKNVSNTSSKKPHLKPKVNYVNDKIIKPAVLKKSRPRSNSRNVRERNSFQSAGSSGTQKKSSTSLKGSAKKEKKAKQSRHGDLESKNDKTLNYSQESKANEMEDNIASASVTINGECESMIGSVSDGLDDKIEESMQVPFAEDLRLESNIETEQDASDESIQNNSVASDVIVIPDDDDDEHAIPPCPPLLMEEDTDEDEGDDDDIIFVSSSGPRPSIDNIPEYYDQSTGTMLYYGEDLDDY